jgi:hypothetical protein
MAIVHAALKALSLYEELTGTFAVDNSGTPGDFLAVPAVADSMSWDSMRPFEDPNVLQQYKHGRTLKVHGPRAASLAFKVPLALSGILADATTASADEDSDAVTRLLKIAFGGCYGGNMGSAATGTPTTTTIIVTGGHGARFTAGGAIGWVNGSGLMEIREIEGVSTDTITLKHALSAAPTATDVIYNATTFYLDDLDSHAQWLVEGFEADDYWSIRGSQIKSLAYDIALGKIPMLDVTMQAAEWAYLGSGSLTAATYANHTPYAYNDGEFLAQVVGTATRNILSIHSAKFETGLTYIPAPGEGTNTVLQYVQDHTPGVVRGNFGTYYENQTWYTAWLNQTLYSLAWQIGTSSSGGWLLTSPSSQLGPVKSPRSVAGGLLGSEVPFEGGLDTDTTDQTTAIRRSSHRLHRVG